jgi:hypothetical protein
MISRKKTKLGMPFPHNPDMVIEYNFEGIEVGDHIKFTGTKGTFKFLKLVHNPRRDVTWIDCMSTKTGEYRSFYSDRLKRKVTPKRKRRKSFQIDQAVSTGNSSGKCSKCKCDLNEQTASPSIFKRGSGYCRECMRAYIASKKS